MPGYVLSIGGEVGISAAGLTSNIQNGNLPASSPNMKDCLIGNCITGMPSNCIRVEVTHPWNEPLLVVMLPGRLPDRRRTDSGVVAASQMGTLAILAPRTGRIEHLVTLVQFVVNIGELVQHPDRTHSPARYAGSAGSSSSYTAGLVFAVTAFLRSAPVLRMLIWPLPALRSELITVVMYRKLPATRLRSEVISAVMPCTARMSHPYTGTMAANFHRPPCAV